MTTTELHRPEPLADFLDRGGNPRDVLDDYGFQCLVEDIYTYVDVDPEGRAHHVALERAHVESAFGGPPVMDRTRDGEPMPVPWGPPNTQQKLLPGAWGADLVEQYDVLAPRLRAS